MSPSDSVISVDTTSTSTIDIGLRRSGIAPSKPPAHSPHGYTNKTTEYLHQPKPQLSPLLSRHYETLQEHADSVVQGDHTDVEAPTPRHDTRRESFACGPRTAREVEAPQHSRNPMMPKQKDNSTVPSMAELVRRTTSDNDTSSTRGSSLRQVDTIVSRPSTTRSSFTRSSTSSTDMDSLTRPDTKRSSDVGLARGMTTHVPVMELHQASARNPSDNSVEQSEEDLEPALSAQDGKRIRKLSFRLPPVLNTGTPSNRSQQSSLQFEESLACKISAKTSAQPTSPKCVGLSARRQVKLDLKLPMSLISLPNRHRTHQGDHMSSITPSRPRSPKTPLIGEQVIDWIRDTKGKSARSAPIVEEEDQTGFGTMVETSGNLDLMPRSGTTLALAPTTPATPDFVRPPQKFRDRCYISRSTINHRKSGGFSTSESDLGSTPDGHWTPDIKAAMTDQEVRTQDQLGELAKTSKSARSRRWPWNRSKTSGSDEQVQDDHGQSRIHISANTFVRSNRNSETPGKEKKEKRGSKALNSPWRREKPMERPPLPSASLANMLVPPAFVPPGCEKVLTPLRFDAASEIRGKLADFFFESGDFSSARRKPKASSGGYWDSDAVLMSMHTDIDLTDDDNDEEGPEGPPPVAFHFGPVNDTPGPMLSPRLMTGPEGYLTVKGLGTGASPLTPGASQDSWFRMHYGDHTLKEESLTAAALKEADEKRKFEWLVPEHLPNSPLCPLHVKYVGPSKGLCYWHGRKSNGWGVELGVDVDHPITIGGPISAGWSTGKVDKPKNVKKKRRLESLNGL